jgi:hypothetical protein
LVYGTDLGVVDLAPKSGVLPRARDGAKMHTLGSPTSGAVQMHIRFREAQRHLVQCKCSLSKAEQFEKRNDDLLLALLNKS